MSDNIRTDAIELLVTKEDFIELMDDNCKQLKEIERLTAENGLFCTKIEGMEAYIRELENRGHPS